MLSLQQFSYIDAVATHGSFLKAAKACFVTQPTLSMQIQKLEKDLGVVIFDRSKQPTVPTATGLRIVEQARVVLAETKRLEEIVSEETSVIAGKLSIGVIPTVAPYLLPLFIERFLSAFPSVSLQVEEMKTEDIVEALAAGSIDAGILATPLEMKSIYERVLYNEPFYLYAPASHRLAKKRSIKQSDLEAGETLLLNEGHCLRQQTLNVCGPVRDADKNRQFYFESGSLETIVRMVERGQGYTVVPHLAKIHWDDRSGVIIPFSGPVPYREISLVTHRSQLKRKLLEALADVITTEVATVGLHQTSKGQRIDI